MKKENIQKISGKINLKPPYIGGVAEHTAGTLEQRRRRTMKTQLPIIRLIDHSGYGPVGRMSPVAQIMSPVACRLRDVGW